MECWPTRRFVTVNRYVVSRNGFYANPVLVSSETNSSVLVVHERFKVIIFFSLKKSSIVIARETMSYNQAEYQVSLMPVYEYDFVASIEEFLYGYYLTLESAPHEAWRSYTVGAQYMHMDGEVTGEMSDFEPAVGHHQIHSNIMYQQFSECKFRVRSINVQHTFNAYLVLVTGEFTRNQNAAVMFIQSFLIDRIPEINQFAICNSILKVYTTD